MEVPRGREPVSDRRRPAVFLSVPQRANTGDNWRWDHTVEDQAIEDRAIKDRAIEDRGKLNC